MEEEEKKPNPMYVVTDVVEDILLRLPLKPTLKFKSVSKQWRSTLESNSFAERRKSFQKKQKILAVGDGAKPRFEGDAEIEMVYLQRDGATTRPSLTCDGLVCIPVPGWVNVLNPSTGEFLRFPSGLSHYGVELFTQVWWDIFPGYWGFGRDKVNGTYKIVRMLSDFKLFEILDVNIGEWRKLSPPPFKVEVGKKSACVDGSIYWLDFLNRFHLLALDLHTEKFRDVPVVAPPPRYTPSFHIVNLEDRLAMVDTCISRKWKLWKLEIWSMDAQEETWTMTYSINVSHIISKKWWTRWFTPLAISKQGNLFLYDSENRLFKYYPETDFFCCLSPHIRVIAPFKENLVPLCSQPGFAPKITTSGHQYGLSYLQPACVPKISTSEFPSRRSRIKSLIPNILLTSTLVSLIIFGYSYKYCT